MSTTIHATAIVIDGTGLLIRGPSGSGKSSLALALLRAPAVRFARLVADDRVIPRVSGGRLLADAPPPIRGLLEVRGVGLVSWPVLAPAKIDLIVDIGDGPRLPEGEEIDHLLGVPLRRVQLSPRDVFGETRALLILGTIRTSRGKPLAS